MEEKEISLAQAKRIRKSVSDVLSQNGNRLKLILAILLTLAPTLFYFLLWEWMAGGIYPAFLRVGVPHAEWIAWGAEWFFSLLFTLFFQLPMALGLFFMATETEAGKEVSLSDVFWGFSAKNYGKALAVSFGILWKFFLLGLVLFLIDFFTLGEGVPLGIQIAGAVFSVGAVILFLFLWMGKWIRLFEKFSLSEERMPGFMSRRIFLRYLLDFLPWILLSALTFFVLFLADTLPRMLLSYARTCRTFT